MSFKFSTKIAYYPTLLFNVLRERYGSTQWYHVIDDTVILGALPFRTVVKKVCLISVLYNDKLTSCFFIYTAN